VDLACYRIEAPPLSRALRLRHLNPVLVQQGAPDEIVNVTEAQQLCVPVRKNQQQIPQAVLDVIRYIDLECYRIQGPPLSSPLTLTHLNPLFGGFGQDQTQVLTPRQICTPVVKAGAVPPPAVLDILRVIDIKKYDFAPAGANQAVALQLTHINPVLFGQAPVNITQLFEPKLGLPVQKTLINTTGAPAMPGWLAAIFGLVMLVTGWLWFTRRGTTLTSA
jgi:hypothetical protein